MSANILPRLLYGQVGGEGQPQTLAGLLYGTDSVDPGGGGVSTQALSDFLFKPDLNLQLGLSGALATLQQTGLRVPIVDGDGNTIYLTGVVVFETSPLRIALQFDSNPHNLIDFRFSLAQDPEGEAEARADMEVLAANVVSNELLFNTDPAHSVYEDWGIGAARIWGYAPDLLSDDENISKTSVLRTVSIALTGTSPNRVLDTGILPVPIRFVGNSSLEVIINRIRVFETAPSGDIATNAIVFTTDPVGAGPLEIQGYRVFLGQSGLFQREYDLTTRTTDLQEVTNVAFDGEADFFDDYGAGELLVGIVPTKNPQPATAAEKNAGSSLHQARSFTVEDVVDIVDVHGAMGGGSGQINPIQFASGTMYRVYNQGVTPPPEDRPTDWNRDDDVFDTLNGWRSTPQTPTAGQTVFAIGFTVRENADGTNSIQFTQPSPLTLGTIYAPNRNPSNSEISTTAPDPPSGFISWRGPDGNYVDWLPYGDTSRFIEMSAGWVNVNVSTGTWFQLTPATPIRMSDVKYVSVRPASYSESDWSRPSNPDFRLARRNILLPAGVQAIGMNTLHFLWKRDEGSVLFGDRAVTPSYSESDASIEAFSFNFCSSDTDSADVNQQTGMISSVQVRANTPHAGGFAIYCILEA